MRIFELDNWTDIKGSAGRGHIKKAKLVKIEYYF